MRRPGWCFKCGKIGHETPNCPGRDKSGRRGNNKQSSPTDGRQSIGPQRNTQVNTDPFLIQNQMQESGHVLIQEHQGQTPPQPPIPPNRVVIDQQGRTFFSGQVEQGQQGGFYGYYLPQASQQQIEAWHLKNGNGLWNQIQEVQVDTSKPPPPIARLPPTTISMAEPVERAPLNMPHQCSEEHSPPNPPPRQTVVKQVKIDTTTTPPREWAAM